jgi:hypothetical protein
MKRIAKALENRNALEASGEGMTSQQAADSPANDHTMTICRDSHSLLWSDRGKRAFPQRHHTNDHSMTIC